MYKTVIPPSDGQSSDEEVFEHFLSGNNLTKVSNADCQPAIPNAEYSELLTV